MRNRRIVLYYRYTILPYCAKAFFCETKPITRSLPEYGRPGGGRDPAVAVSRQGRDSSPPHASGSAARCARVILEDDGYPNIGPDKVKILVSSKT